jgi:hypothetical protein
MGIAAMIAAVGVVVFAGGAFLRNRYDVPASMCRIGPIHMPGLPGVELPGGGVIGQQDPVTIDFRGTGAECNAAAVREQLGNSLDLIGGLFVIAGVVFLIVVIIRRPTVRGAAGRPVARQSRPLGALLIGFGRAVMVAGAIGLALLLVGFVSGASPFQSVYTSRPGDKDYDPDKTSIDWVYILLYVGLIAASVLLVWIGRNAARRGRRHLQASAEELRATDPRPPVLYLRSFEADDVMAASRGLGNSAEESLVAALNAIGPVVALGEPGEKLPPLGAARAYSTDDRWQLHISDWAAEASQVVLLAGHTSNFWWEVRHLVASGALDKAVFLLPGGDAYHAFRERFMREVPGIPLPATLPGTGEMFAVAGVLRLSGNASRLYPVPPGTMTKARWMAMLVGSPTG